MRLLLSASRLNTNTIGAFIIRHFDGSFPYETLSYPDAYASHLTSKINRVINYIFPFILIRKMDRLFLRQVEEFKPTIILIFKGMEISKWSLKKIRKKGIRLVNYNFDHPYDFFSRGTGNKFVREAIPYYDLHISYSSVIANDLHSKFQVRSAWIPFGFHLTETDYQEVIRRAMPEVNKVCFVGNPDSLRIEMIQCLQKAKIPVDLYGFGWEKVFDNTELLTINMPRKAGAFWEEPIEFWQRLRQYRVQLNFFRPHNAGSHNLRTFEVPAVGGILLTPNSEEQADFFDVNKEIFFYSSTEELIDQCKWLLNQDKAWIDTVRVLARSKSITQDYSYRRRTKDLLKLLVDTQ